MVTRILNFLLLSFCLGNIKTKHKKYTYVANFGFIWIPLAQWPSFFDHLNWKPFKIDFANLKKTPEVSELTSHKLRL